MFVRELRRTFSVCAGGAESVQSLRGAVNNVQCLCEGCEERSVFVRGRL